MKSFSNNPNKLKQTILLKEALREYDIDPKNCRIQINHDLGFSIVNTIKLPIIFPKSFFESAKKYHDLDKKFMFYFNGNPGKNNNRKDLLKDFIDRDDSKIVFTNDGRIVENKGKVNEEYFSEMAQSHYSLAPHQPNWKGDVDALWTYRYIECLMLKTIPVQFKSTPLSPKFTAGTIYKWNDETFDKLPSAQDLEQNYNNAKLRFSLSKKQIKEIRRN